MPSSVHIFQYAVYGGRVDNVGVGQVAGAMINHFPLNAPIPDNVRAHVVEERAIHRMKLPFSPITKMARREHVDAFFRDGLIRLGTFRYFNGFDHEEITDVDEGHFILAGRSPSATAFVQLTGGFDQYALCSFTGSPDPECIRRFGYDDAFVILDPHRFTQAISNALRAEGFEYANCTYSPNKVVVGEVPEGFDFQKVSTHLHGLTTSAKFYVKPQKYSHQREFRFLWRMPADVGPYIDLLCPEAVKFCERMPLNAATSHWANLPWRLKIHLLSIVNRLRRAD